MGWCTKDVENTSGIFSIWSPDEHVSSGGVPRGDVRSVADTMIARMCLEAMENPPKKNDASTCRQGTSNRAGNLHAIAGANECEGV